MESPRSMLRIFLGCTSVDLQKHRDAASRRIELFDEHPVVMEDFGARDGDATAGLAGPGCAVATSMCCCSAGAMARFPTDETLSVTHLEYRAARDAGMPRLIFLADPETEQDDGPDALFPATVRDHGARRQPARLPRGGGRENVSPPSSRRLTMRRRW